jgi:hypothetical protein
MGRIAWVDSVSKLKLRHYTTRFRESERLCHCLPRLVWLFVIRASGARAAPRHGGERPMLRTFTRTLVLVSTSFALFASALTVTTPAAATSAPEVVRVPVNYTQAGECGQDTITWSGEYLFVQSFSEDHIVWHISGHLTGIGATGTRYTSSSMLNLISYRSGDVIEEQTQVSLYRQTAAGEAVPYDDAYTFLLFRIEKGSEALLKLRYECAGVAAAT